MGGLKGLYYAARPAKPQKIIQPKQTKSSLEAQVRSQVHKLRSTWPRLKPKTIDLFAICASVTNSWAESEGKINLAIGEYYKPWTIERVGKCKVVEHDSDKVVNYFECRVHTEVV
jgi:hypothetical protein